MRRRKLAAHPNAALACSWFMTRNDAPCLNGLVWDAQGPLAQRFARLLGAVRWWVPRSGGVYQGCRPCLRVVAASWSGAQSP